MLTSGLACGSKTGLLLPDAGEEHEHDGVPDPELCPPGDPVDLLFVVDNSRSMAEEQESLAAGIPALVDILVRPPDGDGDGLLDWNPATNLQVGVINTDMGIGDFRIGTCERPRGGDGILRNIGDPTRFECLRRYPRFLTFGGEDEDDLIRDLDCIVNVGTEGCGHEQPLEAALKAVTPSTSDLRFHRGNGHGDGQNAGFLRPGSFFVLVILSDEDDCSASDENLFDPESEMYTEHPNMRCYVERDPDMDPLHPISRYVEGFLAVRRSPGDRMGVALIVGVPEDLAVEGDLSGFSRILADPRLEIVPDSTGPVPELPQPSCEVPDRGRAHPPRRLVEFARQFAPQSTAQSICQADFGPALTSLARLIGDRPGCVPEAPR